MGLFAFRRLREQEAASAASPPPTEPPVNAASAAPIKTRRPRKDTPDGTE